MNKNKNWKVIYLGVSQESWDNINIKSDYYNARDSYGAFGYMINSTFYKELLHEFNKFDDLSDQTLAKFQKNYNCSCSLQTLVLHLPQH